MTSSHLEPEVGPEVKPVFETTGMVEDVPLKRQPDWHLLT